jgi:predicted Zn-dependent protease
MTNASRTGAFLLALASILATACSINPATGQRQFTMLSRDDEVRMGADAAPQFTGEFGGKVQNIELAAYVSRIGQALAAKTEGDFPSLPWEFTFVDSDQINAFALPGGKIFMTRGLASKMTNEAQLAAVLGHEVGHVTARHINDSMFRQSLAGLAAAAIGAAAESTGDEEVAGAGNLVQIGGGLVLLKFGRDQESQADALGIRYMTRLGYDPRGSLQVMQILQQAMAGGRQPELLSTHPYPETRVERIQALLRTEYASTQNNPAFTLREPEFRTQFLAKLAATPHNAPGKGAPAGKGLSPRPRSMPNDPGTPVASSLASERGWCHHCAEHTTPRTTPP